MRRYWKNLLWGVLALVLCACAAGHEIVGEAVQQPPEALLAETEAAPAALVETREEMVPVREWTYVLAAAFPVIEDGVQAGSLEAAWRGEWSPEFKGHTLLAGPETAEALRSLWGEEAAHKVQVTDGDLLELAWQDPTRRAILPFEALEPRWKVLRVGGISPLDDDFDAAAYALTITSDQQIAASGQAKIARNREEEKMTSVVMSGTTAMVRVMAFQMEEKGILYPGEEVGDLLAGVDILHVSNEVPMFTDCPPAVPLREEQRFCSAPDYIALFEDLGVDVVELTGNHILDWGRDAFVETLGLYDKHNLPYYGGGRNIEAGQQPYVLTHNGNQLAFIGCNAAGPENVLATGERPGAAPCDIEALAVTVRQLREEGYLSIVTFQHFELEDYQPVSRQRVDMLRIAREGAVVVSGSQAHYPQTMTFVDDAFVHYGLGNFLFDQMYEGNRRGFLDRHIFYDGKYISTELITIILEDGAQPRPMSPVERQALLEAVFEKSNWSQIE
ncbi:MAG: CapA family protein [Anaerolineaceae bacterium]|jgi:poly-gamma-glutamate synthesis protein (capsule biosynthesis protein)|nr:CapA family protein [Anaerolineaceae bacterium]